MTEEEDCRNGRCRDDCNTLGQDCLVIFLRFGRAVASRTSVEKLERRVALTELRRLLLMVLLLFMLLRPVRAAASRVVEICRGIVV